MRSKRRAIKAVVIISIVITAVYLAWRAFDDREASSNQQLSLDEALPSIDEPVRTSLLDQESPPPKQTSPIILEVLKLFETGSYQAALDLAKHQLTKDLSPDVRIWLEAQLPQLLVSKGWLRLKQKRCNEAINLFQQALSNSSDEFVHKGLIYCYYKTGYMDEALKHVTPYLKSKTIVDRGFDRILVELFESRRMYRQAIAYIVKNYQKSINPDSTSIKKEQQEWDHLLAQLRNKLSLNEFQDKIDTNNFSLIFHSQHHSEIAEFVIKTLDEALNHLQTVLPFVQNKKQIEVLIYTPSNLKRISSAPHWASGVFDGRIRLRVDPAHIDRNSLATTIYHELTHALLFTLSGGRSLPGWFDEGLAQASRCFPNACAPFRYPAIVQAFSARSQIIGGFSSLSQLDAQSVYLHSLFLFYNIVMNGGQDAVIRIIEGIHPHAKIESDDLIYLAFGQDISFNIFYDQCKNRWEKKVTVSF